MRNCDNCGKEYQESWRMNVYSDLKEDCAKCYKKKYCPHIYINDYDNWIKNARENLIKTKDSYYRELLRENQSYKKFALKNHLEFCIT